MKHLLLIAAIVFTLQSPAQNISFQDSLHKISDHELALQYISKGKQQKKAGNILALSGSVLILAGIIVAVSDLHNGFNTYNDKGSNAGDVLVISGLTITAVGIPFAFIGRHNLKKGELLLQSNNALPSTSFKQGKIYSVGVKIDL